MTPSALRKARKAAGLTQAQAGALVFASAIQWSQWECGYRQMPKARQELFKMKLSQSTRD